MGADIPAIRQGTINDIQILAVLGEQTFRETYSSGNSLTNLDVYISKTYNKERITSAISLYDRSYLIAEINGVPVGFVKLRKENIPDCVIEKNAIELNQIYVLEKYHSIGIGGALIEAGLNEARKNRFNMIWLGVWEQNRKAIQFYKNCGFIQSGYHTFWVGNDKQNDLIFVRGL